MEFSLYVLQCVKRDAPSDEGKNKWKILEFHICPHTVYIEFIPGPQQNQNSLGKRDTVSQIIWCRESPPSVHVRHNIITEASESQNRIVDIVDDITQIYRVS